MDVEGFEYDVLDAMLASAEAQPELLPQQLGLEIHYKTRFRELPWFGRYKSAGEIALFMDSRASHVLGECGPDVARPHPFCWLYNDFFESYLC